MDTVHRPLYLYYRDSAYPLPEEGLGGTDKTGRKISVTQQLIVAIMHRPDLELPVHEVYLEFKQLQEKGTTVPFSCSVASQISPYSPLTCTGVFLSVVVPSPS